MPPKSVVLDITPLISALLNVNGAPLFDLYVNVDLYDRTKSSVYLDLPTKHHEFLAKDQVKINQWSNLNFDLYNILKQFNELIIYNETFLNLYTFFYNNRLFSFCNSMYILYISNLLHMFCLRTTETYKDRVELKRLFGDSCQKIWVL